jgi:peptidoglycan/LPS O-acetylase OafA/YrhL
VAEPPARVAVLDGLRLVAALAVAGYHLTVAWRVDGVHPPAYFLPVAAHVTVYGFLGVELFFLVSGFVIAMSGWGRPLGAFFASRVSRLYPAYWAAVVVTTLVVLVAPVWLLIVAALAVIAGLAWLVHRFVERPLARRLRAALTRGVEAASAPARTFPVVAVVAAVPVAAGHGVRSAPES